MIKRIISAILAAGVIAIAAPALAAHADSDGKVFVCKFVGTPGVDERLQTGGNPIDVSINSLKDYNGVGSYFNDAQGRSFALAEDNGQAEPPRSACRPTYKIIRRMHLDKQTVTLVPGLTATITCGEGEYVVTFSDGTVVTEPFGTSRKGSILRVKQGNTLLAKLRESECTA